MKLYNVAIAVFLLVLCSAERRIEAHAILLAVSPTIQQQVTGPDLPVTLRFNSRIDGKRSRVLLVGPRREERTLSIEEQSSPDTLKSVIKGLGTGSYILRWQVLANDGHITRGE